jgi:hypothetical protein
VKIFQDLTIKGDADALERFVDEIEASLKENWSRDRALEDKLRPFEKSPGWCFAFAGRGKDPAAFLWLANRTAHELYVPNIVPAESGRLSHDQYNRVLQDFYERFVKGAASKVGVHADLSKDSLQLEDVLTAACAESLRRFSALANKSTGSSHPRDRQRWEGFLISAHLAGSSLDAETLERWLVEEERWPEDQASELAIEYEKAMYLLKAYDDRTRDA